VWSARVDFGDRGDQSRPRRWETCIFPSCTDDMSIRSRRHNRKYSAELTSLKTCTISHAIVRIMQSDLLMCHITQPSPPRRSDLIADKLEEICEEIRWAQCVEMLQSTLFCHVAASACCRFRRQPTVSLPSRSEVA
jgi:hypothetical protein